MDINYLLAREQTSLRMAETSPSKSARAAHSAFAKAYGLLLAASKFRHARLQPESAQKKPGPVQGDATAPSRYDEKTDVSGL